MIDGIVSLLVLGVLGFGLLLTYKKRAIIAKWLEDPDIVASQDSKTQRMNLEHRMAVNQRKLEIMDELSNKEK